MLCTLFKNTSERHLQAKDQCCESLPFPHPDVTTRRPWRVWDSKVIFILSPDHVPCAQILKKKNETKIDGLIFTSISQLIFRSGCSGKKGMGLLPLVRERLVAVVFPDRGYHHSSLWTSFSVHVSFLLQHMYYPLPYQTFIEEYYTFIFWNLSTYCVQITHETKGNW